MTPPAVPSARAVRPGGLPAGVRRMAVFAVVVSGLVSCGSIMGASRVSSLEEILAPEGRSTPALTEAQRASSRAFHETLAAHREARMLLLMGLMFTSALATGAALRLINPRGLPREGMRRLLSGAAVSAAVLRTVDGAQLTAAVHAAMKASVPLASAEVLKLDPALAPHQDAILRIAVLTLPAFSVALTVVMAGSLLLVGQYFRSARVRDAVLAEDLRTQRG